MDQDEFVLFAELDRQNFDKILQNLKTYFQNIEYGRQGDDWIWIHFPDEKIEIDSFYSMNLEVKGKRKQYAVAKDILSKIKKDYVLEIFDPPKVDLTR
jgi:hypothetical protein